MDRLFGDLDHGFSIDVGSMDPVHDLVSKAFDDRGWLSANVEANPYGAAKLADARPRDHKLTCVLGSTPLTSTFDTAQERALGTPPRARGSRTQRWRALRGRRAPAGGAAAARDADRDGCDHLPLPRGSTSKKPSGRPARPGRARSLPRVVPPGLRPRKWCSEPSRLGPVGRCLWSGGHRVILIEKASSERSHHDGHHLLLWTSSPSCQSTWPRLTRISCARCSAPSSRRSWVPRSMRSAALPTTMRAPSAPIGATGIAAVLGIRGLAPLSSRSRSSARAPTSPTGTQSAVVARR